MTDKPEGTPVEHPEEDGLALNELEQRLLAQDQYDDDGHLSRSAPGDVFRELIHEIRQTRTAIRLAQATFVSKTELEKRLQDAGRQIRVQRQRATRRFYFAIGAVFFSLLIMGAGGVAATTAYVQQQREYEHDQYVTCLERNAQVEQSKEFMDKYVAIEARSQDRETANRVIALLREYTPQNAPNCKRLAPGNP